MTKEATEWAFDPFFTTKKQAAGSAMGLAGAYGIVKDSKKPVTVFRKLSDGSTFNVFFSWRERLP